MAKAGPKFCYLHTHTHTHIEREREREREISLKGVTLNLSPYVMVAHS